MKKFQAVIFDIDGTLTGDISWTALTRDLGGSVDDHMAIFNDYREGRIDYPESKRLLLGLWRATGNANKSFIEHVFANWPLRDDAPDLIRWLGQRSYELGLITGSLDLYAKSVAKQLGIGSYYANTELVFDKRDALVDYHYEKNQAAKKLSQLESFCATHAVSAAHCVVVGDGENDLELFRETGHGILVGNAPSDDLKESAWKRVGDLSEIKQILEQF